MLSIRLISWNEEDAARRARELEKAGVKVDARPLKTSGLVAQLKDVAAVCIDLDRLPADGREIATALRNTKTLRHIAIVFAGGPRDKVASIKKKLPDAIFTEWSYAAGALRKAVRSAPKNPVIPPSHMERYASAKTGLVQKLGIAAGMQVALVAPPTAFRDLLADLPANVAFTGNVAAQTKLAIWFARSKNEVEREMEFFAARLPAGAALWVAYPKQSGKIRTDLTQNDVRNLGLAAGLVDYKICAIDADWTGLKFARKKR